jgi:hypothetical protein
MGSGTVPFPNSNNNFGEVAFQKQIKVQLANDASLEDAQLEVSSNPNDAGYSAVTSTDPGSWGTTCSLAARAQREHPINRSRQWKTIAWTDLAHEANVEQFCCLVAALIRRFRQWYNCRGDEWNLCHFIFIPDIRIPLR